MRRWYIDDRWSQSCSAPSLPEIPGRDPDRHKHIQVGWGAETILNEPLKANSWDYVREYAIRLDTTGQQDLSADEARLLAAHLLTAATQMAAARAED